MDKPKLLPVGVPWMIDPATPFMRVYSPGQDEIQLGVPWMSTFSHAITQVGALGEGARERLYVVFVSYFGLEDKATTVQLPSAVSPRMVQSPGDFDMSAHEEQGPYRMLRLTFYDVADNSVFRSGDDFVPEEIYDCSILKKYAEGLKDREEARKQFWETWRRTGLCPDPLMYEVEASLRVSELRRHHPEKKGLRHYLLLGHDIDTEIVAARWTWEQGQTLKGW